MNDRNASSIAAGLTLLGILVAGTIADAAARPRLPDEGRLLESLEERAALVRARLRRAHDPFLADCRAHLDQAELSAAGRSAVGALAIGVFDDWVETRGAQDLAAMIRRLDGIFDLLPDAEREALAISVADIAEPEFLSEETRRLLLGVLDRVLRLEAREEMRRLSAHEPVETPARAAEAEVLASRGEWMAAYRALPEVSEESARQAVWTRIRNRLVSREAFVPLRIEIAGGEKGPYPALDAFEALRPDDCRRVAPGEPPRLRGEDGAAPFPGSPEPGAFEIVLPPTGPFEIEIPLEGGGSSVFVVPLPSETTLRIPGRFPAGMTLFPVAEPPFFVDRTETPAGRLAALPQGKAAGFREGSGTDPALLRRDPGTTAATALAAARALAAAEGKQLPREAEWRALVELWAGGRVRRRWNFGPDAESPGPVDAAEGAGPLGIHHVIGNAWEMLDGGRLAGGGTSDLPFELARDTRLVLERTYPWEESAIRHVGVRLVIRLGREGE